MTTSSELLQQIGTPTLEDGITSYVDIYRAIFDNLVTSGVKIDDISSAITLIQDEHLRKEAGMAAVTLRAKQGK